MCRTLFDRHISRKITNNIRYKHFRKPKKKFKFKFQKPEKNEKRFERKVLELAALISSR